MSFRDCLQLDRDAKRSQDRAGHEARYSPSPHSGAVDHADWNQAYPCARCIHDDKRGRESKQDEFKPFVAMHTLRPDQAQEGPRCLEASGQDK